MAILGSSKSFVIKLTNENIPFGSRPFAYADSCRSPPVTMFSAQYPVQIMHGGLSTITTVAMIEAPKSKKSADDKSKTSKYARFGTDLESFRDASQALPYVYKFFWMIYRLSPVRTIIIIAVFLIQGILPALRLRTGGDFIRQVICTLTGVF